MNKILVHIIMLCCISAQLVHGQTAPAVGLHGALNLRVMNSEAVSSYGSLTNTSRQTFIDSGATLYFLGETWSSIGSDPIKTGGTVVFQAPQKQYISGDTTFFSNLNLNNSNDMELNAPLMVQNQLNFNVGKLLVEGQSVTLKQGAGFANYSSNRYVVIDSARTKEGYVVVEHFDSSQGWLAIPIGTSEYSYSPMAVQNSWAPTDFRVTVYDNVLDAGLTGSSSDHTHCGTTWWLSGSSTDTLLFNLRLQYDSTNTTGSFDSAMRFISVFTEDTPNTLGDSSSYTNWSLMRTRSLAKGQTHSGLTPGDSNTGVITEMDSLNDFSGFSVLSYPSTSLPVSMLHFNAEWATPSDARITWATASELNNKDYVLYRSDDGHHFERIATVAPKNTSGYSVTKLDYTYTDHGIPPHVQTVYYKLIQEDFDGSEITYGPVALTRVSPTALIFKVYPVPASSYVVVQCDAEHLDAPLIHIYTSSGKLVYEHMLQTGASKTVLPIDLSPGLYYITVQDTLRSQLFHQRLIIQ